MIARRRLLIAAPAIVLGLSSAAQAQMLQMIVNAKGSAGGGCGGGTTWNPSDAGAHFSFSNCNLTATSTAGISSETTRATTSKSSGKWYFETTIGAIAAGVWGVGVGNASASLSGLLGGDSGGAGFFNNGVAKTNGANTTLTGSVVAGSVIGCAVDVGGSLIWWKSVGATNPTGWNENTVGSKDPATGVGGFSHAISGALFPACGTNGAGNIWVVNFGATSFTGSIPSGFTQWG